MYSHGETGTGIVLHALDVPCRKMFTELVMCCSDMCVLFNDVALF